MFKYFYLFSILSSTTWVILNIDGAGTADVSMSSKTQHGNIKDHLRGAEKRIIRQSNRRRIRCGHSPATSRIVGGNVARFGAWPWMGILCYGTIKPGNDLICDCGATLIDREWALTAAHCVQRTKDQMYIGFNVTNSYDFEENLHPKDDIRVKVKQTYVHPLFDMKSNENDIALIRLDRTDKARIEPVCLPRDFLSVPSYVGKNATVIGWGTDHIFGGFDHASDFLNEIELPIVSAKKCYKIFKNTLISISSKNICAGGQEGKDSCEGDSGGPMMIKDKAGRWVQIGVVSLGRGCGEKDTPATYMRVFSYLNWIAWVTKIRF